MKRAKFSRRTLLRGALGGAAIAVGLPALEIFLNNNGTAYAGGDALPKRFGIFFWGNGVLPDRWVPKLTGPTWELSPTLMPLAGVKDQISVISGMRVYTGNVEPHRSGPVGMFTGADFPPGETMSFAEPSIDQLIASAVGEDTRFKSLEVAAQPGGESLSFNGIHSNNPAESSPAAFFQRVFIDGFVMPGSVAEPDPKLPLRKSILDGVMEEAEALQGALGSTDKARLEQHLDGIRALEKQIDKLSENPPSLAACAVPKKPLDSYGEENKPPNMSEISRVLVDTMVMALACDQTRVFSHWFAGPVNNVLYPGMSAGHHQLTHDETGDQPQVHNILLSIMGELAYLVEALRAVPEGASTLLDHCALLATTDCSYGKTHSLEEYPILIAGGCNGALKTGLHYRSPSSENASKVLLTLARAMGMTLESFGKGNLLVNSSLSAIEV